MFGVSRSVVRLHALNMALIVLATAIAGTAVWLHNQVVRFSQLQMMIRDFNSDSDNDKISIHWPQAAPWLFILAASSTLVTCGIFFCVKGDAYFKRMHAGAMFLSSLILATVSIVVLLYAVGKPTTEFFHDITWDGYNMLWTENKLVKRPLSTIERQLGCCGPDAPLDYKTRPNGADMLPQSCCHSGISFTTNPERPKDTECTLASEEAREKPGCIKVATKMVRVGLYLLSALSLLASVLGIAMAGLALVPAKYAG